MTQSCGGWRSQARTGPRRAASGVGHRAARTAPQNTQHGPGRGRPGARKVARARASRVCARGRGHKRHRPAHGLAALRCDLSFSLPAARPSAGLLAPRMDRGGAGRKGFEAAGCCGTPGPGFHGAECCILPFAVPRRPGAAFHACENIWIVSSPRMRRRIRMRHTQHGSDGPFRQAPTQAPPPDSSARAYCGSPITPALVGSAGHGCQPLHIHGPITAPQASPLSIQSIVRSAEQGRDVLIVLLCTASTSKDAQVHLSPHP